ncbi:MAG: dolichyl-phosphate-mannose--protein mannosyltransferase [Candidatus Nanopelagicaceae bacterium]
MFPSIVITFLAFMLRIFNLSTPKGLVFDEIYYVDGARDYLKYGVEVKKGAPEFVVHPPVGKWLIAAGIKLFGNHEFGWRIAVAVAGTLTVYLTARIAQRIFHEHKWATLAALLMALDGLNLVMSRTALLDIFLTLFVLLAVNAWLKGKYLNFSIYLGLAMGSKWSAIYFVALFLILEFVINRKLMRTIKVGVTSGAIYILTWFGWFSSTLGWDRDAKSNPFASLIYYHKEMLGFHTGLTEKHSYQANPWSWIVMGRPTSFLYESPKGCGAKNCAQEVLAIGTPILWWLGAIALIVLIGVNLHNLAMRELDFSSLIPFLGIMAGYLPWFFFQKRTVFTFYAVVFAPFLILAIVLLAKLAYEYDERLKYVIAIAIFAIAINFLYFYPVFTGGITTYDAWYARMWWNSWI